MCTVDILNTTVTVDAGSLAGSLLGRCDYASAVSGASYLYGLFESLGDALGRVPRHTIVDQLNDMSGKALSPRASVTAVLLAGADAAGVAVANAMTTLSDTLSCDAVNDGVTRVTDSVCCDVS